MVTLRRKERHKQKV